MANTFDPRITSRSNAKGLMQMIPPTAEDVKRELKSKANVPEDLYDPWTNIRFCAHYLAQLIKKSDGNVAVALASYNAGPTRISG
jgi:soluble lytic murein transglycosylase